MNAVAANMYGVPLHRLLAGLASGPVACDVPVTGLALGSRDVLPGDLFLACQGLHHHGLEFLGEAVRRGAAAVAWEPGNFPGPGVLPVASIRVEGLSRKAGLIADRFFDAPSSRLTVIGLTGTNGKTTVSHLVAQALDRPDARCGVIGTLGTGLYGAVEPGTHTTPDAIQVHRALADFVTAGATTAVMEVSSHALHQGRVNGVRFDTAVFTNLSRDHLDYHGDMIAYAASKRELFDVTGLKHAVINADDATGRAWLDSMSADINATGFSLWGPVDRLNGLWVSELDLLPGGMRLTVGGRDWGEARLETSLVGEFNASNLLAALSVLLHSGYSIKDAAARLSDVKPVPGRMERYGAPGQPTVVVDYAHTPDALQNALTALRWHVGGNLLCVFGCGGDRDRGKRPLMGRVAETRADRVIITDDNPRTEAPEQIVGEIQSGLARPERIQVIHDRRQAIVTALEMAGPEDCVLVAGKGHESHQQAGNTRLPFDDRAVVRNWLEARL